MEINNMKIGDLLKDDVLLGDHGWGLLEIEEHRASKMPQFFDWFSDHPRSFGPKPVFWVLHTPKGEEFFAIKRDELNPDGVPDAHELITSDIDSMLEGDVSCLDMINLSDKLLSEMI